MDLFKSSKGHAPRRVFRYERHQWKSGRSIFMQDRWTRLVKISCQCDDCRGTGPDMDDDIATVVIEGEGLTHGRLYNALFVAGARDHETGNVEEWHWQMIPLDEDKTVGKPST